MSIDLAADNERAGATIGDHQSIRRGGHHQNRTRRIVNNSAEGVDITRSGDVRAPTGDSGRSGFRAAWFPAVWFPAEGAESALVERGPVYDVPGRVLEVCSHEPLELLEVTEVPDQQILGHRIVSAELVECRTMVTDDA